MKKTVFVVVAVWLAAFANPAAAQTQGGPTGGVSGPGSTVPMGGQMGSRSMTSEQFNQLQDYADMAHRLTKEDKEKGRTLADLLAEDKANASAIVAAMPLSCEVNEAILAAQGPVTVDGKTVETKTYEVSCANGMGYFLVSQEPGKPYSISCFTADAVRAADIAAGQPPGAVCTLPSNANLKAMATSLMSSAGKNCTARDHRLFGRSNTPAATEYDEVVCTDNSGYMLSIAMAGSTAPVSALTCHESALRGRPCKLSDNGISVLSLQGFKDALAQRKIACDAGDQDMRVIGQQNTLKRYVVEFRCSQRPMGMVAFIPLDGSAAPFEVLDCTAAAKRGAICKLTTKN